MRCTGNASWPSIMKRSQNRWGSIPKAHTCLSNAWIFRFQIKPYLSETINLIDGIAIPKRFPRLPLLTGNQRRRPPSRPVVEPMEAIAPSRLRIAANHPLKYSGLAMMAAVRVMEKSKLVLPRINIRLAVIVGRS